MRERRERRKRREGRERRERREEEEGGRLHQKAACCVSFFGLQMNSGFLNPKAAFGLKTLVCPDRSHSAKSVSDANPLNFNPFTHANFD